MYFQLEAGVKYSVVGKKGYEIKGDLLVCGIPESGLTRDLEVLDRKLEGLISRVIETGELRGKPLETAVLHTGQYIGAVRLLLIGTGNPAEVDLESLRKTGGTACRMARELNCSKLIFDLRSVSSGWKNHRDAIFSLAEGAGLSLYRFTKHRSEQEETNKDPASIVFAAAGLRSLTALKKELDRAQVVVESTAIARDLSNEPANALTPTLFAAYARKVCRKYGLKMRMVGKEKMKELGMGGILAVSAGSGEPPALIVAEHNKGGRGAPMIVVVGKGITFDSGGISIKPSEKMEDMKYDKAGACSVLGIMSAVARLDLPLRVIGLMPLCENLPGGRAYKPGDVVKMHSGKTVEVISTDAEGRMIVADALSYANKFKPDAVFDLATLTGACVIALGLHATGIVGNDSELIDRVLAASERTGERTWNLPTWKEYREQLESDVADLKNVGGREAGTITAGLFLREFVGDTSWVHLDIAGTAWVKKDCPYLPRGATGVGVRLIVDILRHWPGGRSR